MAEHVGLVDFADRDALELAERRRHRRALELRGPGRVPRRRHRPGVGILRSRWEVMNQDDEIVLTMEGYGMFRRRSTAAI